MIISTAQDIPGKRMTQSLGLVRGSSVRARHLGKDILAIMRNIAGGEIHDRMIEEAESLGADAVIAVRFQTSMVQAGAAEMLCYGTAVVVENDAH